MRLLFLNYEYPPLGGGAANATRYLLQEFAKNDRFRIDLICSSSDKFELSEPYSGIRVHRLDIGKSGRLHYQTLSELANYTIRGFQYAKRLMADGNHYDGCLAFFGLPCGWMASRLRIPYIVSLRGSDVPYYNPRFRMLDQLAFARISRDQIWRRARAVVANSEGLRELALKTAPGQEIGVIPNGVDTVRFHPAERPPQNFELLCVARLTPRKGIRFLIEALPLLPSEVRLSIAGDGPERAALESLAKELQVSERVRFLGAVPHEQLPPLYQGASLFVLPSRNEGMSNTVLEAMASGLPLLLTDTGGTRELLTDGVNGRVIPMDDPASLAEAARSYLGDPNHIARHGVESRRRAEQRDWASVAGEYTVLFEQHFGDADRG